MINNLSNSSVEVQHICDNCGHNFSTKGNKNKHIRNKICQRIIEQPTFTPIEQPMDVSVVDDEEQTIDSTPPTLNLPMIKKDKIFARNQKIIKFLRIIKKLQAIHQQPVIQISQHTIDYNDYLIFWLLLSVYSNILLFSLIL